MRRLSFVALALIAAGVVACSSASSAPGWTYAPAPSVTPAPSGSASAAPSASASAAPSASATAQASASASAAPSGSGGAEALTITAPAGAATTGFDPATLEGPANTAFSVTFDNQDTTTGPHNWVLKDATGAKIDIGDTTFFQGPTQKTYQVPALAPGDYPFDCEVHPAVMKGTLTIK